MPITKIDNSMEIKDDNNWMERCRILFNNIKTETSRIEAEQTTEMFLLYNHKITPRETGRSCGACRLRVYVRLKEHYEMLKNKNSNE